jgi:anti-anti-sigma factor
VLAWTAVWQLHVQASALDGSLFDAGRWLAGWPGWLALALLVSVSGRVDHRSAAQLEQALADAVAAPAEAPGGVVLDFAGVEYISSVGLRVLMVAARQLRDRSATLAIAALQPVVAEIFAISRFDRVLAVHVGVAEALSQASPAALAAWRAGAPPPVP